MQSWVILFYELILFTLLNLLPAVTDFVAEAAETKQRDTKESHNDPRQNDYD